MNFRIKMLPPDSVKPFDCKTIALPRANYAITPEGSVYRVIKNSWLNTRNWYLVSPAVKQKVLKELKVFTGK